MSLTVLFGAGAFAAFAVLVAAFLVTLAFSPQPPEEAAENEEDPVENDPEHGARLV